MQLYYKMARQYAVVEFEKMECAIVPLLWIIENNERTYWPNSKNAKVLRCMVEDCTPPNSSWPLFTIVKVHSVCESLKSAEARLTEIIEQSTSESGQNGECLHLINYEEVNGSDADDSQNKSCKETELPSDDSKGTSSDSEEYVDDTVKRKLKQKSRPEPKRLQSTNKYRKDKKSYSKKNLTKSFEDSCSEWPDSSGSENGGISNNPKSAKQTPTWNKENDLNSSNELFRDVLSNASQQFIENRQHRGRTSTPLIGLNRQDELTARSNSSLPAIISQDRAFPHTPNRENHQSHLSQIFSHTPPPTSTESVSLTVNTPKVSFEETVIKKLETIIAVQDQNATRINEIYRILSDNKIKSYLTRPDDFPLLPIDQKEKFKLVERQLREKPKYDYLKNRLAAIGGSSVRLATNNIMKYIFTNKFAKKFNWAGHNEKKSFKKTTIWQVVRDAVHLHFSDAKPSDLNDTIITKAVQDWLRLAGQRHTNEKNKN